MRNLTSWLLLITQLMVEFVSQSTGNTRPQQSFIRHIKINSDHPKAAAQGNKHVGLNILMCFKILGAGQKLTIFTGQILIEKV